MNSFERLPDAIQCILVVLGVILGLIALIALIAWIAQSAPAVLFSIAGLVFVIAIAWVIGAMIRDGL